MPSTPIHPVRQIALLCALLLCADTAQAATLKAWCRSVTFSGFRDYDPALGYYQVLFTTKDTSTTTFPLTYASGGLTYFSQELRQFNATSVLETDYAVFSEFYGTWVQYGSMALYLPVNDNNGNGMPDWMELENAGNETAYTGTYSIDWPSVGSNTPYCALTRAAGSQTGTYSLRIGTGPTTSGTWGVSQASGSVSYNRTAGTVALSVSINGAPTRTGTASLTLQGNNQSTLGAFALSAAGQPTVSTAGSTVLTRVGTAYRGELVMADGNTASPWADFTRWRIEITDTADTDGDGVPDLSDALLSAPAIVRQSTPRFDFPVTPGYAYRLRGSTDLVNWTDYATHTASGAVWQYTPPAGSRAFLKIVSP